MAALTQERNTVSRDGRSFSFPVAADVVIYQGALVALSATGYAKPAVTAVGLTGLGRAAETVDNSAGADGAVNVPVERGVYLWNNAGDVTLAHVGDPAYAVDDQTVSASSDTNTRSQIGTVRDVNALGVWVEI